MKSNKNLFGNTLTGFTLIEVLITLTIIAILMSFVAPYVLNRPDQARDLKLKFDFEAIESALALYKLDNGKYPAQELGFDHLVNGDNGSKYLSKIPQDPWGENYIYKVDNNVVEIISLGPDGLLDGPEDDDVSHILN
ncbi:type II secretion system major pseudopilin GspG [Paracoccaceae bacterium]|jgi:general secretion pathway protein G|nr:type II secretion system major pseudopilin GspG [Paracoccaceae bacterium]